LINKAYKIKDQEALHMAYYIIENEGIFVGGSSALNLAAAVKYGREHPNSKIVTVIHDLGNRYLKKFYSGEYLATKGINFEKKDSYDS
jgi:cysteine synthase A